MPRHAAIGIDDDLAAGEARIAMGAADHEAPGWIDEETLGSAVVEPGLFQHRPDDIVDDRLVDGALGQLP